MSFSCKIKKRCILLILTFAISNVLAQEKMAVISFEKKKHDFGILDQTKDSIVSIIFHFENKGDIPLIIYKVTSSCGCTVPEWTQSPIEAGQKGQIKVIFNSKGFSGKFSKSIYVKSNAKESVAILKIEGEVVKEKTTNIFNLFRRKINSNKSYLFSINN